MSDLISSPVDVHMDLTETGIVDALKRIHGTGKILIVGLGDAVIAGRLACKYGIENVVVVPTMKQDSWCLAGDFIAVYSEGA